MFLILFSRWAVRSLLAKAPEEDQDHPPPVEETARGIQSTLLLADVAKAPEEDRPDPPRTGVIGSQNPAVSLLS